MRWYIEISQEGQPTQKLCLEASHWQPALQKAREIQGASGKLKGLAVEILDEGCRAVDSDGAMTYVVTPASDDASLIETLAPEKAGETRAAQEADEEKADGEKAGEETAAAPKAASSRASLRGRRSRREKLSQRRKQRRESKPPGEPAAEKAAEKDLPRAGSAVGKTMLLGTKLSDAPDSASAPAVDTIGYGSEGEAIITEPPVSEKPGIVVPPDPEAPPVTPPPPAPPDTPEPTDVGQTLISERNERATADNPLRYHERVYAVRLPQPLAALAAFLNETLAAMREGLEDAAHVIRVALYDHVFSGKPKSPPIATLSWCGWRDDSELIFFPYADKPAATLAVAEKVIGSDTLGPGNVPPPAPKRDLEAEQRAEQARLASEEKKKAEKAAAAARQAEEARKADAARKAAEAKAEQARQAKRAEQAEQERAKQEQAKQEQAKPKREQAKPKREAKPEKRSDDDAGALRKTAALGSGATRGSRRSLRDRKSVEPKPAAKPAKTDNGARISQAQPERRVKIGRGVQALRPSDPGEEPPLTREQRESRLVAARREVESLPPPVSVPGDRVAGEQLLTDLFEEIAQLHYLEDALEGADFVLKLALQKLPSEVGLVSLFDIDKREYVVVRQAGGERSGLLLRVNERAEVPRRAMRKSRAVVLPDVGKSDEKMDERWDKIGTKPRSMICAPVEKAGRYLGLIELLNPHDGGAFSESDGHALTYIGQQYGEFLSNRGVTLDPDAVVANARR